jgi:hypothetical protein
MYKLLIFVALLATLLVGDKTQAQNVGAPGVNGGSWRNPNVESIKATSGYSEVPQTITATATTVINAQLGTTVILNQAVSITALTIQNPLNLQCVALTIQRVHDASASTWTIAWGSSVKWPAATAPTLTQTTGAIDIITMITFNYGVTWYASSQLNMG